MDREIAVNYICNKLKVQGIEQKFASQPLELLNEITYKLHYSLPFQNLRHVGGKEEDRIAPTVEENIKSLFNGYGGMCWENNSAVCVLLQAIGYQAELYLASVVLAMSGEHGNHAVIVISDLLEKGDQFLVDVGFGAPFFEAVNLDFKDESESQVITQSFKTYKFVKRGELYVCMHGKHEQEDDSDDKAEWVWSDAFNFRLVKHTVEDIRRSIDNTEYSNPESFFNKGCVCCKWIDERYVCIRDHVFLKEDDSHKLQPHTLKSNEEFLKVCREYFPEIDQAVIQQALTKIQLFTDKQHQKEIAEQDP